MANSHRAKRAETAIVRDRPEHRDGLNAFMRSRPTPIRLWTVLLVAYLLGVLSCAQTAPTFYVRS